MGWLRRSRDGYVGNTVATGLDALSWRVTELKSHIKRGNRRLEPVLSLSVKSARALWNIVRESFLELSYSKRGGIAVVAGCLCLVGLRGSWIWMRWYHYKTPREHRAE